jgi:hypothetical protein
MRMHRSTGSAVRDRIDAVGQAIMARLSAERSQVLDGFLPTLSRSADFFALWSGISAGLAAGLTGMVTASTASNLFAKGLVRRPRPAVKVRPARAPGRTPVTISFPSGHAGIARVANGVHYPSDIIGVGGWRGRGDADAPMVAGAPL